MLLSWSIKLSPCFYTYRNTAHLLCPRGSWPTLQEYLPKILVQLLCSSPCCKVQVEKKKIQQPFTGENPGSGTGQWFIISVFSKWLWIGRRDGRENNAVWHPVTLLHHHMQELYKYVSAGTVYPYGDVTEIFFGFKMQLGPSACKFPALCPAPPQSPSTKQRWFHENVKQKRVGKL